MRKHSRRSHMTALVLIFCLMTGGVTGLLVASTSALAQTEEPATEAPTAQPTDVPAPTPAEPTLEPTAEPTPEPTAEPTPLPTDVPTLPTTGTPTPEPTETSTPEPTAEPTATEVSVPDTIECAPFEEMQVGLSWQFNGTCTYTINSARAQTQIQAEITAAEPAGWTVQLAEAGDTPNWSAPGTTTTLTNTDATEADTSFTLAIRLTAPELVEPGQSATVTISSAFESTSGTTTSGPGEILTAHVPEPAFSAAMIVQQPGSSALQCSEQNGDRVLPGDAITYQCSYDATYTDLAQLGSGTTIQATMSSGWDVGLVSNFGSLGSPSSAPNGDGLGEIDLGAALETHGSITVTVLAPVGSAPNSTGVLTLTATIAPTTGTEATGTFTSTSTIGNPICSALPGMPVTASLVGGALPPIEYSNAPQTVTEWMTIEIANPQQCTGWVLDISATNLVYSGSAPSQANLPASMLRVINPDNSLSVLSNSAQRLVEDGGGDAEYALAVELVIPGGAAIGTYSTTLTITTTAAPAG